MVVLIACHAPKWNIILSIVSRNCATNGKSAPPKWLPALMLTCTFGWTLLLHYNGVMMSAMASQITSPSIVCWTVQAKIKEYIEAPRHRLLWGEFTGDRWIPLTGDRWFPHKGPVTRKMLFPFDDVIMDYDLSLNPPTISTNTKT